MSSPLAQPAVRRQTARLRYLHIAPRKVRLIADTIRGMSVQEAEAQLLVRSGRPAQPLLKLLRSATANAKQTQQLNPSHLFIAVIRVDQGPMLKRSLPRAQGRATPIQKKLSHVTLILEESAHAARDRFAILPPPKKEKTEKKEKPPAKGKTTRPSGIEGKTLAQETTKKERGFFRKIFRRKSV